VKDRVHQDIGAKGQLLEWDSIPWKTIEKHVRNLRQRIFRATQEQQWNKVRSLMKLMLRSFSNLLLSVRKVTQQNKGRKTAGIDDRLVLDSKSRARLVRQLSKTTTWRVSPGKRIYIPKANGNTTPTLLQNSASAGFGHGKSPDTKRHINALFAYLHLFHKGPDHITFGLPI